jgi:hypothetical protein|tara:strand:+ start:362 stop:664 length:303 start_codon:yes stop_codon:yes gene_type:complete
MKNNRKSYRIFKALSKPAQNILKLEYEICKVENYENKKWNNRFQSFWNWLWMTKFKKRPMDKVMKIVQKIENFNAKCTRIDVVGFTKEEKQKIVKGEPWI